MGLKLFLSPICPPCRTVQLVINALKLKVDVEYLDILSKSYLQSELLKVNPQHSVPTLVDKDFVLWESHAISIYLIEKYAPNYVLYPVDPQRRAVVNQRLHFDSGTLYPCLFRCVVPVLFAGGKAFTSRHLASVKQAYYFTDKFLEKSSWLAEDHITLADFSCMTTLSTLDYLIPINEKSTPNLYKYLKRCQALPYYDEFNQEGLNKFGKVMQERLVMSQKKPPTK